MTEFLKNQQALSKLGRRTELYKEPSLLNEDNIKPDLK